MLALPDRITIIDYSRPKPDHYHGAYTIHLPAATPPPPPKLLMSGPLSEPVITPLPPITPVPERLIEYGHVGLAAMSYQSFADLRLATERLEDAVMAYVAGHIDKSGLCTACNKFFAVAHRLPTVNAKPRPAKAAAKANPYPHISPDHAPSFREVEGKRLAAVLFRIAAWVIDPPPTCSVYRDGDHKYVLHPGGQGREDGLFLWRQAPSGASWLECLTPVFSVTDLAVARADLQRQYDRLIAPRRLIVDRGPILSLDAAERTQAEIDRLNAVRAQEGIGLITSLMAGRKQSPVH